MEDEEEHGRLNRFKNGCKILGKKVENGGWIRFENGRRIMGGSQNNGGRRRT
jgi:hypothetical protein